MALGSLDATVRMLVCANCGAALPASPLGGGQVECRYCRAVAVITPRDDRPLGSRGPVDEAARVARLWTQLHIGLLVHDDVPALMENGRLPDRNEAAAMRMWEDRRRKQVFDPASVGDDLVWLTQALSDYYGTRGDIGKARALWESALEVCHEPRHLQFVRGSMARLAVKSGDLRAAADWLRPCDPQPEDLLSDSAYRLSYAYLATAQGRYGDVVLALGPTTDALPFFFTARVLCAVLRANAIEKQGDVGTAAAQLEGVIAAVPGLNTLLPQLLEAHRALDLCPQSAHTALGRAT